MPQRRWLIVPFTAALVSVPLAHAQTAFETYCTPTDPGLTELSGMTWGDGTLYAMGDSGADDRIAALDEHCGVSRWIPNPVDPFDVEDLTFHDGSLWLADTGDNDRVRPTIALTRVDPKDGRGELYRLKYPDGAHDAEAVAIAPNGEIAVITKEWSGHSRVYTLSDGHRLADLASPGPTPLVFVGELVIPEGSNDDAPLVTGAAMHPDGKTVAIRTYWNAYLYPIGEEGLAHALTHAEPKHLSLPPEPQGEAIAFDARGDVLIASEAGNRADAPIPPILISRSVDVAKPVASQQTEHHLNWWWWVLGGIGAVAVLVEGMSILRPRKRK
ncbi:hypothetical protein [Smaragdicoccus niigatensis]|uniref:hypothetical protein n=1 Tax=Smaragdicoccus niigatensis TaxID=359359 RepID=UPI0003712E9D|nr:hypothetical protein [Smaragdicoccus niigatensis]